MADKLLPSVPDSFYLTPHAWEVNEDSSNNDSKIKNESNSRSSTFTKSKRPSSKNHNNIKPKKEKESPKKVKKLYHNTPHGEKSSQGKDTSAKSQPIEPIKKKINILDIAKDDTDWNDLLPGQDEFDYAPIKWK